MAVPSGNLLSIPSPQGQPLDSETLSRVPATGRRQKRARSHGAVTVLVLRGVEGGKQREAQAEYLRPRTHGQREAGSQICKDMKTYRGGGPKGVVKFHLDGTPLRPG